MVSMICGRRSISTSVVVILCVFEWIRSVNCAILKLGNPLSWKIAKPHLKFISKQGINQFIDHYKRSRGLESPTFLWGDEIEYGVFKLGEQKEAELSLRAPELRKKLLDQEELLSDLPDGCIWQPEYGNWMVEATPRDPYTGYVSDLLNVEKNMQLRRKRLHAALEKDEIMPSITTFPMLGVKGYSHTNNKEGPVANSQYISDNLINPHPRFTTLTRNIRERRGSNVNITVPLDDSISKLYKQKLVHMDAMAFGMGSCCLQVTMQCRNEFESRLLADQLAVLSPLFLSLSASSPLFHGHLVNSDTRWNIISQAVDDRTPAERGEIQDPNEIQSQFQKELVGGGIKRLSKSRYSSVSLFIGKPQSAKDEKAINSLNDLEASIDEDAYDLLVEGGVDKILAAHVAHMFTRDPLVIFDDTVPPAVNEDMLQQGLDHFESLQSTNWRTVRWKPPTYAPPINSEPKKFEPLMKRAIGPGWRVEFRPLEVQLTDFENAAFAILTILAARCILAMGHSFYLPISYVEENMKRANKKDSVLHEKFYIRKCAFRPLTDHMRCDPSKPLVAGLSDMTVEEMTINEFFNGKDGFLGLIPAISQYLDALGCDILTKGRLMPYLNLLQKRAAGELPTNARWIRNFVTSHPSYIAQQEQLQVQHTQGEEETKLDLESNPMPPDTVYDLLKLCDDVGMGKVQCPELVGDIYIEPLEGQHVNSVIGLLSSSSSSSSSPSRDPTVGANMTSDGAIYRPLSVCEGGQDVAENLVNQVHLDAAVSISLCGGCN